MQKIIFIGLLILSPLSYSEDSAHTRLVLGGVAGCSDCVDINLNSLNLNFDPGFLTAQSVQVVIGKSGGFEPGYMIRGKLTDKGLVIVLFSGLSHYLKKDSLPQNPWRMFIRTDLGRIITDKVIINQVRTVNEFDIAFLQPIYNTSYLEQVAIKVLDDILKTGIHKDKEIQWHPYSFHPSYKFITYTDKETQWWNPYTFFYYITEINYEHIGGRFHRLLRYRFNEIGERFHRLYILNEKCNYSWLPRSRCTLRTYCMLSETMGDEVANKLMNFQYFQEFIDEVIADEINKPNWSWPDFHSHEALNLWHRDLCRNITQ